MLVRRAAPAHRTDEPDPSFFASDSALWNVLAAPRSLTAAPFKALGGRARVARQLSGRRVLRKSPGETASSCPRPSGPEHVPRARASLSRGPKAKTCGRCASGKRAKGGSHAFPVSHSALRHLVSRFLLRALSIYHAAVTGIITLSLGVLRNRPSARKTAARSERFPATSRNAPVLDARIVTEMQITLAQLAVLSARSLARQLSELI